MRLFTILIKGHSHLGHYAVPYFILPGVSVVRIFSVLPLLTLSVGAQYPIDPSLPAVSPARRSIPSAKAQTNFYHFIL